MNVAAERADAGGIWLTLGDTRKMISFPDARATRDALTAIIGAPDKKKWALEPKFVIGQPVRVRENSGWLMKPAGFRFNVETVVQQEGGRLGKFYYIGAGVPGGAWEAYLEPVFEASPGYDTPEGEKP